MIYKSIEQLENDIWKEPNEFPTEMVENCYKYRKIDLPDLTVEQIRLLISQKIGIEHLLNLALEKLETNVLVEGDLYKGDLLEVVSRIPEEHWCKNTLELQKLLNLVEFNTEKIKEEMGEKQFDIIYQSIIVSSRKFK